MTYRIKVTKKQSGAEYVQIVQTLYDPQTKKARHRSVESYGNLQTRLAQDPDFLEKLKAHVEQLNQYQESDEERKLERLVADLRHVQSDADNRLQPTANYGLAFYRALWEKLGLHTWFDRAKRNSRGTITYDLDLYTFFLVSHRILFPASKKKTFEMRNQSLFDFSDIKLDHLYDVLGVLAAKKDTIIRTVNKAISEIYERVECIAFYDVTTFYFESFDSDELRARGMSKENKTNEVQVVLGLLTDGEGIPLTYEIFRGNTAEMKTLIDVVNDYRTKANLSKVTVVADRGLNSNQNLADLRELGFEYIVAQSINRLKTRDRDFALSQENWEKVYTTREGEDVFKVKTFDIENAAGTTDRVIVTWSKKREMHDLAVLEERAGKALQLLKQGDAAVTASIKHGVRQFLTGKRGSRLEFSFNSELYEKRRKFAGFYAVVTSKVNESSEEIYKQLRMLWHIEECFRVMKSGLDTSPVFVWSPEHIRGHFLVCYLALVLERLSYKLVRKTGLDISGEEVIDTLRAARLAIVQDTRHDTSLLIRLGISRDEQENEQLRNQIDQLFQAVDLPALNSIESTASIKRKLRVKLPITLE